MIQLFRNRLINLLNNILSISGTMLVGRMSDRLGRSTVLWIGTAASMFSYAVNLQVLYVCMYVCICMYCVVCMYVCMYNRTRIFERVIVYLIMCMSACF